MKKPQNTDFLKTIISNFEEYVNDPAYINMLTLDEFQSFLFEQVDLDEKNPVYEVTFDLINDK